MLNKLGSENYSSSFNRTALLHLTPLPARTLQPLAGLPVPIGKSSVRLAATHTDEPQQLIG